MPLRIRGVDTVLRCIALQLWWLLLCIALLLMCLRLRSWFIRHLCIARSIVLLFGDTTHTGRVPTVTAGRLGSCPECSLAYTRHHAKRCVQTWGSARSRWATTSECSSRCCPYSASSGIDWAPRSSVSRASSYRDAAGVRRGYNVFLCEIPGNVGAVYRNNLDATLSPDTEKPIGTILDHITKLPGVVPPNVSPRPVTATVVTSPPVPPASTPASPPSSPRYAAARRLRAVVRRHTALVHEFEARFSIAQ
jgi:hypothetical protein